MRLNTILLVDDNAATNLVHQKMIQKSNITNSVLIHRTGDEAIEFLEDCNNDSNIINKAKRMPDLILLDINMPGMSGWDFMEEYEKINFTGYEPMIFMLTTSHNPDDNFMADAHQCVKGFLNKPFTSEMLKKVVDLYFEEKMLNT